MALKITWLYTKIRCMAFAISNIFGCNNLCHLSCDFYDYVGVSKIKWIIWLPCQNWNK